MNKLTLALSLTLALTLPAAAQPLLRGPLTTNSPAYKEALTDGLLDARTNNLFRVPVGTSTNLVVTNISVGQVIRVQVFPTNGCTVTFPQQTAANTTAGWISPIWSNAWQTVIISKPAAGETNFEVLPADFLEVAGSGVTRQTNYDTRVVTTATINSGNLSTNTSNGSLFLFAVPGIGTNLFQIRGTNPAVLLVTLDTNGLFTVSNLMANGSAVTFMTGAGVTNVDVSATQVRFFPSSTSGRAVFVGAMSGAGAQIMMSNGTFLVKNLSNIPTFTHIASSSSTVLPGSLNVSNGMVVASRSSSVVPFSVVPWDQTALPYKVNFFQVLDTNASTVLFGVSSNGLTFVQPATAVLWATNWFQVNDTSGAASTFIDSNGVLYVQKIVQTAGGTAADFQGALMVRGGNIIDALSNSRISIPGGGDTTLGDASGAARVVLTTNRFTITSSSSTGVVIVVVGAALGTTNLMEFQSSAGVPVAYVGSNGTFVASIGSVSQPSYSFWGRTNTGIYGNASFDGVYLSVAGVAKMAVDSGGPSWGNIMRMGATVSSPDISLHRVSPYAIALSNSTAGYTRYFLGGSLTNLTTPIASAGASETNLQSWSVPGNVLTNAQDTLRFRASGRFAATSNAKQIKVIWGSETILDSTSQVENTGAWVIEGTITRTGNTSQTAEATLIGPTNVLFTAASAVTLSQTNGIATLLRIASTASGNGDVTNRSFKVEYWPEQ